MAAEDWLGITEDAIAIADKNDDELTANLNRVLERNYKKLGKDMLKLYNRLEDADPKYIQVELSKLKQSKIALQILSPKDYDRYEKEFDKLMQQQSALGVTYGDLMTQALSNPPELVEQFGQIDINTAAIALNSTSRLKNQTKDAAKDVKGFVADNLLRGGSNFQLAKDIQGRLGTSKAQAETIARTESTNVLNESSRQRYQQYGAEYLQLIALVDERTTPWCRYRHMKIIKITDEVPSYHYNCRTTTAPVDPAWLSADDLKWMNQERLDAQATGLSSSGKAPFDVKKPVFRSADAFVKQETKKSKPKPEPKKEVRKKEEEKRVTKELAKKRQQEKIKATKEKQKQAKAQQQEKLNKAKVKNQDRLNISKESLERTTKGLTSRYDSKSPAPEINKNIVSAEVELYDVQKKAPIGMKIDEIEKVFGEKTQESYGIIDYINSGFQSMNRQARGIAVVGFETDTESSVNARIRRVDKALQKLPSYSSDKPLYRGMPLNRLPNPETFKKPTEIVDEGFTSFSKSLEVAEEFAYDGSEEAIVILTPKKKNSKFKDISAFGLQNEQEVLGQRDSKIVVTRAEFDEDEERWTFFAEER